MKSSASHPLTTKNRKEGGEDFSELAQFFLPSLPGVYGSVSGTIFGGGQSVK